MSQRLQPGIYHILTSPPRPGVNYAQADHIDQPVRALPVGPGPVGYRVWRVDFAPEEEGKYLITALPVPVPTPGAVGWGRPEEPALDGPVLFTEDRKVWEIQGHQDDGTYVISVPSRIVGVTAAVTTQETDLVIKPYPVVPGVELPTWYFQREGAD
ncbi:hypothetical protein MD484_g2267, partial [Candolleomyces efflorescens]